MIEEEQFDILIQTMNESLLKMDEIINKSSAINFLLIKQTNYILFISIVLALAAGMYIGYRWGAK